MKKTRYTRSRFRWKIAVAMLISRSSVECPADWKSLVIENAMLTVATRQQLVRGAARAVLSILPHKRQFSPLHRSHDLRNARFVLEWIDTLSRCLQIGKPFLHPRTQFKTYLEKWEEYGERQSRFRESIHSIYMKIRKSHGSCRASLYIRANIQTEAKEIRTSSRSSCPPIHHRAVNPHYPPNSSRHTSHTYPASRQRRHHRRHQLRIRPIPSSYTNNSAFSHSHLAERTSANLPLRSLSTLMTSLFGSLRSMIS